MRTAFEMFRAQMDEKSIRCGLDTEELRDSARCWAKTSETNGGRGLPRPCSDQYHERGITMLKSHEKFHSVNGKRQILIADDELINREMLGNLLNSDYELIFAVDGQDALEKIRENGETLSLVLLDLLMPRLNGLEVLQQVKKDPALQYIPIIVITSDQRSEIESLTLGASDFIPKPYPQPGVIQARILRTIELSEDRQIINSTERDPLTGLYNREYFYRYAEQFDRLHEETAMDAVVIDINHFQAVTSPSGRCCRSPGLARPRHSGRSLFYLCLGAVFPLLLPFLPL